MKKCFLIKLLSVAAALTALPLVSYAAPTVGLQTVDSLTLTLVNVSKHTLYFNNNMSAHNKNSYDFTLSKLTLKPGQTTQFHAKAFVYQGYIYGLGGTLFLHTQTNSKNTIHFVIGDSAIGQTLSPVIGLSSQNKAHLTSTLSKVTNKNNPRAYDIAIKTATVTIR